MLNQIRLARSPGIAPAPGKKDRTEVAMLAPALIALAIVGIFPFLYLFYLSVHDYTIGIDSPTFCGLKNWIRMLRDSTFWASWARTFLFAVVGLALEMFLGMLNALILYKIPKFQNLILTLLMLPLFVAPIVAGLLGRFLLNSTYGVYAWIFGLLGYHGQIFGSTVPAMLAIILIDVWEWTPLIFLIYFAGLQSMNTDVLEAASIDGATNWNKLIHIILPLTKKIIVVALLIRTMDILRYVDTITITTAGGPADATKIEGYQLVQVAFQFQDYGGAAVLGIIMIFVMIFFGKQFVKIMGKGDEEW